MHSQIWTHPSLLLKAIEQQEDLSELDSESQQAVKEFCQSVKNNITPDKISGIDASNKMIVLLDLIDYCVENDEKVLVFSPFTESLDFIAKILDGKHLFYRLDGTIKSKTRFKSCEDFNTTSKVKIFLISSKAGGEGITLTAASRLILLDTSWNPKLDGKSCFC